MIIAEAETSLGIVTVKKRDDGFYDVLTDGVNNQPGHDAAGVIRCLAFYLHGESYRLRKQLTAEQGLR